MTVQTVGGFATERVGQMLDVERRQQIVAYIEERNGATVAQLSARFGVSEATARRDLGTLSRRGLIERAHGGAVPRRQRHDQGFPEPPIVERARVMVEEKRRIGEAAARQVRDGETILIAGGTTTAHLIPFLAERVDLTVITNSLSIAGLLAPHQGIGVIMLGGVLRHSELSLLGALAEDALENLRADTLFMGSPAVHVDYGLSADDMAEAQTDRALIAAARENVVLADRTKFGRVATVRVATIAQVRRIVTDAGIAADHLAALREQGIVVDVA